MFVMKDFNGNHIHIDAFHLTALVIPIVWDTLPTKMKLKCLSVSASKGMAGLGEITINAPWKSASSKMIKEYFMKLRNAVALILLSGTTRARIAH